MNKTKKQHKINALIMEQNRDLSENNLKIIQDYQQVIIDNVDNIIGCVRMEKHIDFLEDLRNTSKLVLVQVDVLLKIRKHYKE